MGGLKGRSGFDEAEMARFASSELARAADPAKAGPMAAYMKTDMPFYGVQKAGRTSVLREIHKRFRPNSPEEYRAGVLALWQLPHREEKYLAIGFARKHRQFIDVTALPLYERLVREGAWWDFVDDVASNLIGTLLLDYRASIAPVMERWVDDPNMWVRRTAIISQLKHGTSTDHEQLFRFCLKRASEKEFFIRKAIGWALRQYSKTDPETVLRFLVQNRDRLSGLSYREGAKVLRRSGVSVP